MSKPKGKAPADITCKAIAVRKTSILLTEAIELVIENGVVVETRTITRAPDAPASTIAKAVQALWSQLRLTKVSSDGE